MVTRRNIRRDMRHIQRNILIYGISVLGFATPMLTGCQNGAGRQSQARLSKPDPASLTSVQWLDSAKDLGKITEGQLLEVSFRFRNTGNKPLVIERVQPSCGCTIAEQSKAPIAPGAEGQIKASFNSAGRTGVNHKSLEVFGNMTGDQPYTLHFQVEVEKKNS